MTKKGKEKAKEFKFSSIGKSLFLDVNGDLSTTKLMNIIFFLLSISTAVIGIIAKLSFNKILDSNTYLYIGGMVGGSFLQYSYGKKLKNGGHKK